MTLFKYLFPICVVATTTGPLTAQAQDQENKPGVVVDSTVGEIFSEKSWLSRQWDKLPINADIPVDLHAIGFDTKWTYAATIQPAFIKGAQQRLDNWSATLGTNTGALGLTSGTFSLNGTIGAQTTFSRLFSKKSNAITAAPYTFWNGFPWKHEQAVNLLKSGEAVRLEFYLDIGVSGGLAIVAGSPGSSGIGLSHGRGIRFLVDIYRLKEDRVRVRLVSQRNDGTYAASFNLNPINKFDFGTGIVSNFFNRIFRCDLANSQASYSDMNNPPIDTEMYDYIFNLNNVEATHAYDDMMSLIRGFNVFDFLNPRLVIQGRRTYADLASRLFKIAIHPAEKLFVLNKKLPIQERAVDRVFHGKTLTATAGAGAGSNCIRAWEFAATDTRSRTFIKSFDRDDNITYQIFENVLDETKVSFVFGLSETINQNSVNTLFEAEYKSDKSFLPVALSDLIVSQDRRDKDFSSKEFLAIKSHLAFILPAKIFASIDWTPFEKTENIGKNNVSYRSDIFFHKAAMAAMEELDKAQVEVRLKKYALSFPDWKWLNVTPDPSKADNQQSRLADRFDYDISEISGALEIILSNSPKYDFVTRTQAFAVVRKNVLFRQIGAGFIISLLPPANADKLISFRMALMGPADHNVISNYGTDTESKTYNSVAYILKLIADRSFDMRLQVDSTGNISPMNQKIESNATPLQ